MNISVPENELPLSNLGNPPPVTSVVKPVRMKSSKSIPDDPDASIVIVFWPGPSRFSPARPPSAKVKVSTFLTVSVPCEDPPRRSVRVKLPSPFWTMS
jgi:hypothetical protein